MSVLQGLWVIEHRSGCLPVHRTSTGSSTASNAVAHAPHRTHSDGARSITPGAVPGVAVGLAPRHACFCAAAAWGRPTAPPTGPPTLTQIQWGRWWARESGSAAVSLLWVARHPVRRWACAGPAFFGPRGNWGKGGGLGVGLLPMDKQMRWLRVLHHAPLWRDAGTRSATSRGHLRTWRL